MRLACCVLLAGMLFAACQEPAEPPAYVARVGDAVLMQSDVDAALEGMPSAGDSVNARHQVVDQWIENELLYQEAVRLNIDLEEPVQHQLREAERAVLIAALVAPLFEEAAAGLSEADLRTYYETHKDRLRTLEPYVLLRFMEAADADTIQAVHRQMLQAPASEKEARFNALVGRHATDPALSHSLATNYWPESRLLVRHPAARERMLSLTSDQPRTLSSGNMHYYLEVVARVPAGTVPEFEWVEDNVRAQLAIDQRKQLYDRYVQRLRIEARANEMLAVRE